MTLKFIDSFDHYSSAQILRKWSSLSATTISSTEARNGPQAMRISNGGNCVKTLDTQASWVIGFGIFIGTTHAAGACLYFSDSGTQQVTLNINADNTLQVKRGTTILNSSALSSLSLTLNTWFFIEMKVTISNSIGANTCIVKVNGVTWIDVDAGQDLAATANEFSNSITLRGIATYTYFDDLYVCDGNGAVNNDFLGDCRVECKFPDGNGNVNQFVGQDANSTDNYLNVDESPQDDDVTYNEDPTPANQDLYGFEDLAETPDTIFGIQTNICANKDDAGSRSARTLVRSGGTTYDGDDHALSQGSYLVHHEVHETNPDTAAAWTESNFNSAEFGIETV